MQTLLHALTGLGLIVADEAGYANAPACARYLVRGAPGDFGEYFRLQIAQRIYPALRHLAAGLAGTGSAFDTFGELFSRPDEARTFTAAQHAGSLAPARALADRVPPDGAGSLLDVGAAAGRSPSRCARATPACARRSSTSPPSLTSRASTATRPV
jgi:2-hydroxy-4-(methylsulfanyl)butanoate S-methyltransferase